MTCNCPCNRCDLPLDDVVELENYLDKNIVNCTGCGDRLEGCLIPCDFHGCNKNYCLNCTMTTDLQCDCCLRLACCDKTLNIVKNGKMKGLDDKIYDRHVCKDCVIWLQEKYKENKRFLDSLPEHERKRVIRDAPHLYGQFKDVYGY